LGHRRKSADDRGPSLAPDVWITDSRAATLLGRRIVLAREWLPNPDGMSAYRKLNSAATVGATKKIMNPAAPAWTQPSIWLHSGESDRASEDFFFDF
jgi:hypothetical protein